jgi:geranylgeranyl reductase family protein
MFDHRLAGIRRPAVWPTYFLRAPFVTRFDLMIVGGGPAGSAAALQIATRDPDLAARTLLVDKATFPRDKLCGGGVIRQADRYLSFLGVHVDVPSVPIHTLRFEHRGGCSLHHQRNAFRVVRREEFDHALLQAVRTRGITVRDGESVRACTRHADGVRVTTTAGEYDARVVIGADGANGVVRRALVPSRRGIERFVALEVFTARTARESGPDRAATAVFDFRPAADGLHGYYWDFPSLYAGAPRMNRGLGGRTWPTGTTLRRLLDAELGRREQPATNGDLRGATIPVYDPRLPQGARNVVLAGDAVGVDPWLGEGISIAIGTGMLAAHATIDALARGDLDFSQHHRRIAQSAVGTTLRRNRVIAHRFYRAADDADAVRAWLGGEVEWEASVAVERRASEEDDR